MKTRRSFLQAAAALAVAPALPAVAAPEIIAMWGGIGFAVWDPYWEVKLYNFDGLEWIADAQR